MRILFFLTGLLLLFPANCFSQKGMTLLGLQYKPIFPVDFLGTGKITNDVDGVQFETELHSGFNAGVIIRHNFTKLLALETGICFVKRNYQITITDGDFTGISQFRSVSYEIPIHFMVYAQAGEKIYFNGSMGPTLDIFPSNISTEDYYFYHVAFRNHIVIPAVAANIGCEFRTEKSGFFYVGASFQRPFTNIYFDKIGYEGSTKSALVQNDLSGSYLTIDFRYFLPQTNPKNIEE